MNLALFDFDGTISNRDSFLQFLLHAVGPFRLTACFLSLTPQVVAYKLGKYPNYRLKEEVLCRLFAGISLEQMRRHAHAYEQSKLEGIVRPGAMKKIAWHQQRGDVVVVVSASLELVLEPWCRRNGLQLLATRLEVRNDKVTGALQGNNCWGEEKVRRVRAAFQLENIDHIYAYGDSRGDWAMLELATHPFYRPFQ